MTEKRKRRSFKTKKSIITLTLSMSVFLLAIIATTTFVLANQTQSVQSSITISYISQDVSGDMRLRAYYSGSWHNLTGTAQNGFIRLGQEPYVANNIGAANLNSVALDKTNNYIVFECAFKNYGSHMVKVGFSETTTTEENITKVQKISRYELDSTEFNNISNETSAYNAVAVCGVDDDNYLDDYTYYYIKAYVPNLAKNATYQTTHSWTFTAQDQVTNLIINNTNGSGTNTNKTIKGILGACLPILAYDNFPKPANVTGASTTGQVFNGCNSAKLGGGWIYYNSIGEPQKAYTAGPIFALYNNLLTVTNNEVTGAGTLTEPTYITIPDGVTSIADNAFNIKLNSSCRFIRGLTISSGVTNVPFNMFGSVANQDSTCENTLEYLSVAEENTKYYSEKNCVIDKSQTGQKILVVGCDNSVIPNDITKIGENAFYRCYNLTSVSIPATVSEIGGSAFYCCINLSSVQFAHSSSDPLTIRGSVFLACGELTSLVLPDTVTTIYGYTFSNCAKLSSVTMNGVEALADYAFVNSGLESITLPSIKTLGSYTFENCRELEEVRIPPTSTMTNIGYSTFKNCKLSSITLPSSVSALRASSFNGCKNMTSIVLPASLTTIEANSFYDCTALDHIYYTGTQAQWNDLLNNHTSGKDSSNAILVTLTNQGKVTYNYVVPNN